MEPPDELLRNALPELEGALFAYVFGSFGTPAFGSESDLDLAADFGRKLPDIEVLERAERISAGIHRRVDLIDLRAADPIIAMQVLRTGRPVLVRDRAALTRFQMKTPGRYWDWKVCRRPVERAIWSAARESA